MHRLRDTYGDCAKLALIVFKLVAMLKYSMNIVEQRYDFLVDMKRLPDLDDVMFERLLFKSFRHKGWLCNYLFWILDLNDFSPSQQAILRRLAFKFYGREIA